jgi:purine-nucleoside phosphorylase
METSVVYEATVTAQMKMRVLGLTYVSNRPLSHAEILENGGKVSVNMSKNSKTYCWFC